MRRLLMWGLLCGTIACFLRPTLVAITPQYAYVDGCVDVEISGHHLGTTASARLVGEGGEADFISLEPPENNPDQPEYAQDEGFVYHGVVPPSPDLQKGWYDVELTVDGEKLTINDGWYYTPCPGTFMVEAYALLDAAGATAADPGAVASIAFQGCGLRDGVALQFLDVETAAVGGTAEIVSDCAGARVHASVPAALAAGTYSMQLTAPDGTIFPLQSCTFDSGDTGYTCIQDVVTVGGGR